MPPKKTPKLCGSKLKLSPPLKKPKHKTVDYADLVPGELFIHDGDLFIKTTVDGQEGTCLTDGEIVDEMCGTQVRPVTATLTWKYRP